MLWLNQYYIGDGPEVSIHLDTKDPQAPKNKIIFSHATGSYIKIKLVDQMIDHMDIESTILHKDSDEAKRQIKEFQESEEGNNTI